MGETSFYVRHLSPFSRNVKTDVPVLCENPTADHPVFACPLTSRLLCRVFKHHHVGLKGLLAFIHELPCSFPLYDMRVSIDRRRGGNRGAVSRSRTGTRGSVRVGCSGWNYKHWR